MGRRRVPERDNDFGDYINNTSVVLESGSPIGSVRLGLSNNEKIQWLAYRDEWNIIYPQYTDMGKRTRAVKVEKNELKRKFTEFAARPLNKIAWSNNITSGDRVTFNLPARSSTRTPRGAMSKDIPIGSLHTMGGAFIKGRVRLEEAEGRCRKHKWADAVEMKYMFVDVNFNFLKPRSTPDDCPHSFISKTAMFSMDAGQQNLGKRMLAFMRWVNFSNPSHNSGWSMVLNVVVG